MPVCAGQFKVKGWKNTVTLQSGEVILDMSREWDNHIEFYGPISWVEPVEDITKFTQEGTTFICAKQIANKWSPKGTKTIKGELNKDGFKVVYAYIGDQWGTFDWTECKWEISKNENLFSLINLIKI